MCKKISYKKKSAKKLIRRLKKKGYDISSDVHVYVCMSCGLWHIGHKSKRGLVKGMGGCQSERPPRQAQKVDVNNG